MIQEGQLVLFRFPQTDQNLGKLRPALVLRKLPGPYDDWLVCMISSRLSQQIQNFDELISENDVDFESSGLRIASIIRIGRLAIVTRDILVGSIGNISSERLNIIKIRLSDLLRNTDDNETG